MNKFSKDQSVKVKIGGTEHTGRIIEVVDNWTHNDLDTQGRTIKVTDTVYRVQLTNSEIKLFWEDQLVLIE